LRGSNNGGLYFIPLAGLPLNLKAGLKS